uniref:Uncharacterized protein n=1 Tax=Candidatus Kentrum sp. DK TaxID=2126562 RepID=A0A450SR76_9GAMM|nr:MAG: hypothetical protein BECKDK2373B_GA0170837_105917 [Candidatus Kentron sp. DK]
MNIKWYSDETVDEIESYFSELVDQGLTVEKTDIDNDLDDSIVFVHPSNMDAFSPWERKAKGSVHIVKISRSPRSIVLEETDNLHKCEYYANKFSEFPRMAKFFDSAKSGTPVWELLKHEKCQKHLVAAYLFMQGKRGLENLSAQDDVLKDFWEQTGKEIKNRGWSEEIQLPPSWDEFNTIPEGNLENAISTLCLNLKEALSTSVL